MSLTRFTDNIYALRFITLFNLRFTQWRAYRHGIIDENGNKISDAETSQEKAAWTLLHRVVARLKKTIGLLPGGRSMVATLGTTLALLKEEEQERWPVKDFLVEALQEASVTGDSTGSGGETSGAIVRPATNVLKLGSSTPSMSQWLKRKRKKIEAAKWFSGVKKSLDVVRVSEDLSHVFTDEEDLDEFVDMILSQEG